MEDKFLTEGSQGRERHEGTLEKRGQEGLHELEIKRVEMGIFKLAGSRRTRKKMQYFAMGKMLKRWEA